MRIIVRYCQVFGNYTTKAIDLDEQDRLHDVRRKISNKFQIPLGRQMLRLNTMGVTVRLTDDFALDLYDLHDRCTLYVELIQNQQELQQKHQMMRNINLFNKLGLKTIQEEEDTGNPLTCSGVSPLSQSDLSSPSRPPPTDFTLDSDMVLTYQNNELEHKEQLRKKVESLLDLTKKGDLPKIKAMVKAQPELPNRLGVMGWNSFHFAIFCNQVELVEYYLSLEGVDANICTMDHWTPLQLSINKANTTITQLLLNHPHVDLHRLTSKGTALHSAARQDNRDVLCYLLDKKVDPHQVDEQGQLAQDVTQSALISQIIASRISLLKVQSEDGTQKVLQQASKLRPPLVKGMVYKVGQSTLIKHNKRFLVLDPKANNLFRYKDSHHYPLHFIEILGLRDITDCRRVYRRFYMRRRFHYFEVLSSRRHIFCTKHSKTADMWVEFIIRAIAFLSYLDQHVADPKVVQLVYLQEQETVCLNDQQDAVLKCSHFHSENAMCQSLDTKSTNKTPSSSSKVSTDGPTDDDGVSFQSFKLLKELGSGAFGKVFLVEKKDTGKLYAMKALKKQNLILNNHLKYAVSEANILKKADFPFILQLFFCFQTPRYLYLVIEYCPGNDLGFHLARNIAFTEEQARFYIAELVLAVEYLHQQDIVYRDLKPENILLDTGMHIKLADFGLSKAGIKDDQNAQSFCGSPAYLAPELLNNKGSGKAADIYGIGAVLYEMVTSLPPYYDDDIPTMYKQIKAGRLSFPPHLSPAIKALIKKLLHKDPKQRIGVRNRQEIKDDPFFSGLDWDALLRKEVEPPQLMQEDEHECEFNDFQQMPQQVKFYDKDYVKQNQTVNRVINFSFSKGPSP